jgi:Sulfotransferase domain
MGKVLYILSDSFSGSTLLDITCGTIPGVFSAGEIIHLPWELYRDKNEDNPRPEGWCSCLKKYSNCPVWLKILDKLNEKVGFNIYNEPYRFQIGFLPRKRLNRFEMPGERILQYLIHPLLQWKTTNRISNKIITSRHHNSVINSWILFDTISECLGITHVVDSTKDPVRLSTLHNARPNDVLPIVLIRDIRGVVHSNLKRKKDPLKAARIYAKYYKDTLRTLKLSNQRYLLIKYEDFVENPIKERKRIAAFVGKNDESPLEIDTHQHHLVGGNAMRYRGKMSIRSNEVWKKELSGDLEQRVMKEAESLYTENPIFRKIFK